MANRMLRQPKGCYPAAQITIAGNFSVTAGAAVNVVTCPNTGLVVTKTGTGEYTLTFADTFSKTLAVTASVVAATAVDLVAQVKSHSSATGVYVIRLNAAAVPTDPAAVLEVHFVIVVNDSTAT